MIMIQHLISHIFIYEIWILIVPCCLENLATPRNQFGCMGFHVATKSTNTLFVLPFQYTFGLFIDKKFIHTLTIKKKNTKIHTLVSARKTRKKARH